MRIFPTEWFPKKGEGALYPQDTSTIIRAKIPSPIWHLSHLKRHIMLGVACTISIHEIWRHIEKEVTVRVWGGLAVPGSNPFLDDVIRSSVRIVSGCLARVIAKCTFNFEILPVK
jgi:hypothetical protein